MTTIYLSLSANANSQRTLRGLDWSKYDLGVLVSYWYLKGFQKHEVLDGTLRAPRFMLDSGAYSAWNAGASINIDELTRETKNPRWHEAVSLDVIGDGEASLKNALYMKACGSKAFPVFHYGEPWDILKEYKKHFPKIGLSCQHGEPRAKSFKWIEQCFAHAWPHRFHSFGWIVRELLLAYPFHSADASSWELRPMAFGNWPSFNGTSLRLSTPKIATLPGILTAEVDAFQKLQREVRSKWAKEPNLKKWHTEDFQ